jgi:hypothetical protein
MNSAALISIQSNRITSVNNITFATALTEALKPLLGTQANTELIINVMADTPYFENVHPVSGAVDKHWPPEWVLDVHEQLTYGQDVPALERSLVDAAAAQIMKYYANCVNGAKALTKEDPTRTVRGKITMRPWNITVVPGSAPNTQRVHAQCFLSMLVMQDHID